MLLTILKGKIHRAQVTAVELSYEGSCAIDEGLLRAADILPYEQIQIYNVHNGERFSTYAISAPAGSGTISINGAAARRAAVGDLLIIAAYGQLDPAEARGFVPRIVYVDTHNRILPKTLAV